MAKNDNKEKKTSLKDKGLNLDYKMTGNPFVDNKRVQQMTLGDLPSARGVDTESYKDYMDINKVNIFEQDIDKIRAQNQSGWAQAANAAFGGVGKGLLTAAESASYLLDFDNHVKSIQGLDTWEKNWLAEAAGKGKEAIDEYLPIHREDPGDTFDWDDPAFYWGSIQGILDSAVGFGLPGGAIAKGVGLGMKALRVSKLVDLMSKGSGIAGKVTNALASGVVQNYAEGKVMGIETYENTLKDLAPLIQEGKLTDAKAKEIAGEAANEMLLNNRAMILSDAFSLYGMTKGFGSIKNIIKERGFKNRFKDFGKSLVAPNADNLILQGGKEAAEEIAQNVIQMEAQFGAKVKAGMDVSNVPSGALERALSFATSDQALLEGMMGFFGGGPQRILSEATTGNLGKKAVERHNTRYKNQQALIKENEELLSSLMKKSKEVTATKDLLNKKGRTADAELIADMDFAGIASRNFTMGTTEQLENSLKELAAGNATEEQMANLPEDFQKQAQQKLERLAEFEKLWLKHSDKANVSELFTNTIKQENINKAVEINEQEQAEVSSNLMKEIETSIIPRIKSTNSDIENVTFSLDDGGTIDVTFEGEINNKQKEADIKKDFKESLEQLSSYEKLEKLKKDAEVNAVFAEITAEELNHASTEKGEKAFTERVAKSQQKKKAEEDPDIDEQTIREDAEYEAASASKLDELLKKYEADPTTLSENDKAVVEAYKAQKENGTATPAVDKLKARRNAKKNKDPKKQPAPAEDPTDAEIKVADELRESDEEDGVVKLTKETALAWKSADNYGEDSDANKALTDFLENWMMSVEDIDVVYEVDKDIINSGNIPEYNKFKALIIKEEGKEKDLSLPTINEIGKVPVIAKLYRNGEPIVHQGHELLMYLHDDTHSFHERIKETAVNNVREHKTQIVAAHIEGKKLKSKMLEKSNGHINVSLDDNGDYKQNQVSDVLGNLEDVEFLYGDAEGFYRNSEKEESDKINYLSATPGAIYAVTRTANGTEFPLRLYSSKITNSEAELVYELYLAAMSNDDAYASGLSPELKKLIKESDNERISGIQNIVNLNQISVKDLVSSIVYQGYSSTSEKEGSKLYYSKGNEYGSDMQFGKTKMKLKQFQSEEGKQQFIDWITINRKRQVDAENLSDTKYKNFINNNKIVTTNVEKTAGGKLFVQPTVTYSPELESFSKPESTGASKKDREDGFRQLRRGDGQQTKDGEIELTSETVIDKKGRTKTYFENTKTKGSVETTTYTFNMSHKDSSQRNPAGVRPEVALEKRGYQLSEKYIPEGTKVSKVYEIRVDKNNPSKAAATVEFIDEDGDTFRGEVQLELNQPTQASEVEISSSKLTEIMNLEKPTNPGINRILGLDLMDKSAINFLEEKGIISKMEGAKGRRFLKSKKEALSLLQPAKQSSEVRLSANDKIVWGHPGLGKTTFKNVNPDNVLDFDTDFKPEVAKILGLDKESQTSEGLNEWRIEENEEEFKAAMRKVWKKAVAESKKTGKMLVVSDMMFLKENESDFDKIVTTNKETFIDRASKRGDNTEGLESWKSNIDKTLYSLDSDKIIETDKYFSELVQPAQASDQPKGTEVTYTPKGKEKQTYSVVGNKIFNKKGVEVFKNEGVDRNKIFANIAIKQGKAKVVEHAGGQYVVNEKEQIMSVATGKIMKWDKGNKTRKAVLDKFDFISSEIPLSNEQFNELNSEFADRPEPVSLQRVEHAGNSYVVDNNGLVVSVKNKKVLDPSKDAKLIADVIKESKTLKSLEPKEEVVFDDFEIIDFIGGLRFASAEQKHLDSNPIEIAEREGVIFRGVGVNSNQYRMNEDGSLTLFSAENYGGRQSGVSTTPYIDVAWDYSRRSKKGSSKHTSGRGLIIEISDLSLLKNSIAESYDEISLQGGDVTIPIGKYKIHKVETEEAREASTYTDPKTVINTYLAKYLPDEAPSLVSIILSDIQDHSDSELAANEGSDLDFSYDEDSEVLVNAFGGNPEKGLRQLYNQAEMYRLYLENGKDFSKIRESLADTKVYMNNTYFNSRDVPIKELFDFYIKLKDNSVENLKGSYNYALDLNIIGPNSFNAKIQRDQEDNKAYDEAVLEKAKPKKKTDQPTSQSTVVNDQPVSQDEATEAIVEEDYEESNNTFVDIVLPKDLTETRNDDTVSNDDLIANADKLFGDTDSLDVSPFKLASNILRSRNVDQLIKSGKVEFVDKETGKPCKGSGISKGGNWSLLK